MTIEAELSGTDSQNTSAGTEVKVDSATELLKLQKQIEQTTAERDKLRVQNRELKATTGGSEDMKKQLETLMAEKSTLATEFEGYRSKIKQEKLSTHISTALEAAGTKSLSAALKLLDMSKIEFGDDDNVKVDSLVNAINELKAQEPILFGEAQADPKETSGTNTSGTTQEPAPKPAVQSKQGAGAFEEEMKSAKSIAEIQAIMKKYGK